MYLGFCTFEDALKKKRYAFALMGASHILAEDLELAVLEIYVGIWNECQKRNKNKLSMEFPARKYQVNAK